MTRWLIVLALAAVVLACTTGERVKPTRTNTSFTVSVHFGTADEVRERCIAFGTWEHAPTGRQEVGCTRFFPDRNHCEIHAPTSEFVDDEATRVLGHELLHCVHGRYHP
jgi:hypothetical protein